MNLGLNNANAIITGGTKGIGRAIAEALAREGCNVGICASARRSGGGGRLVRAGRARDR